MAEVRRVFATSKPVPADRVHDPHLDLTVAHHEAAGLARLLSEDVAQPCSINVTAAQEQAVGLGNALQRVAKAERGCGAFTGQNHNVSRPYQAMLEHHRLAYAGFARLAIVLESAGSLRNNELARLAAEIKQHIDLAETNHKTSIWRNLKQA
jgi:hypothetical protein